MSMANVSESPCSRREGPQAKEAVRLEPKGTWSGRGALISPLADVAPPADRRSLRSSGLVLVRNVVSPIVSTADVEGAPRGVTGGRGGMGWRRKRRPACNEPDRGRRLAPRRKVADFRQVLDHENAMERPNRRAMAHTPSRQSITEPYREGDTNGVAGCFTAPYQGLSRVLGNGHARFLGGRAAATSPRYPPGCTAASWRGFVAGNGQFPANTSHLRGRRRHQNVMNRRFLPCSRSSPAGHTEGFLRGYPSA
jgi:hypothetical protein